jgi:hypothetical protein
LQYLTGFFPDEKARLEQAKGGASSTIAIQLPLYDINEEQVLKKISFFFFIKKKIPYFYIIF